VLLAVDVLPDGTVLSGHKRKNAAKIAKLDKIAAIVHHDLEDKDSQKKFLILSNKNREKTNEQKGREYAELKAIEERKAKARQKAAGHHKVLPEIVQEALPENEAEVEELGQSTLSESQPELEPMGEASVIAAEAVGFSNVTADKVVEVVEKIDSLEAKGHTKKAEELRETLNTNVAKAHREATGKKKKTSPRDSTRDADLAAVIKVLGMMSKRLHNLGCIGEAKPSKSRIIQMVKSGKPKDGPVTLVQLDIVIETLTVLYEVAEEEWT
jgi:hypothetical protein